jgi:hypothetical protein
MREQYATKALSNDAVPEPKHATIHDVSKTPSEQCRGISAPPASEIRLGPEGFEFDQQSLETFRAYDGKRVDGTRVSEHSDGETRYHSSIFRYRQYPPDGREHHAEQSASLRPHPSLDGPSRSDVYESALDDLSNTPNLLDLSPTRIRQLFSSYLSHSHFWYPIFYVPQLVAIIENFITRHNDHSHSSTASYGYSRQSKLPLKPSSTDVIVFLVLALGEMCLYTRSIDMKYAQDASQTEISYCLQNNASSSKSPAPCGWGTPYTSSQPVNFQPPSTVKNNGAGLSHHSTSSPSYEMESKTVTTNSSALPDSMYFLEAMRLLREHNCDNDLLFAQMYLLSGLCVAHRSGVERGTAWFSIAGDKLYGLLEQHKLLDASDKAEVHRRLQDQLLPTGEPMGAIVVAALSCLRLEIVNSVNVNPGPSRLLHADTLLLPFCSPESLTEYPPAPNTNSKDHKDILFRNHLALVYPERQFYLLLRDLKGYNGLISNPQVFLNAIKEHRSILLNWRNTLPPDLKWGDKDPVPSGVFEARLHAKYYEMMYKTYSPLVDFALHIRPCLENGRAVRQISVASFGNPYREVRIRYFEAFSTMDPCEFDQAYNQCIEAATLSAMAYHSASKCLNLLNHQDIAYA